MFVHTKQYCILRITASTSSFSDSVVSLGTSRSEGTWFRWRLDSPKLRRATWSSVSLVTGCFLKMNVSLASFWGFDSLWTKYQSLERVTTITSPISPSATLSLHCLCMTAILERARPGSQTSAQFTNIYVNYFRSPISHCYAHARAYWYCRYITYCDIIMVHVL